ncbi:hypothetical protein, partial [Klebsiella pneumoniae]
KTPVNFYPGMFIVTAHDVGRRWKMEYPWLGPPRAGVRTPRRKVDAGSHFCGENFGPPRQLFKST